MQNGPSNFDKKRKVHPNNASGPIQRPSDFIDLTLSDSEPPPKRTKSNTPTEGNGTLAKTNGTVSHHVIEPRSTPPPAPTASSLADRGSGKFQNNDLSGNPNQIRTPFRNVPRWAPSSSRNHEQISGDQRLSSSTLLSTLNNSLDGIKTGKNIVPEESEIITLNESDSDESESPSESSKSDRRENSQQIKPVKSSPLPNSHQTVNWKPLRKPRTEIALHQAARPSPSFFIDIPQPESSTPKTTSNITFPIRAASPKSSGVVVQIPRVVRNQSPVNEKELLARFTAPIPNSSAENFERRALIRALRNSSDPFKKRLNSVERLFGHNGFSDTYSTAGDLKRLKNLAQKKVRKIRRKDVTLDFGEPFTPDPDAIGGLIHPREQVRSILGSKFKEIFSPALTFSNEVNMRQLGGKFQFISNFILREGVSTASQVFNSGCRCVRFCDPKTCSCFQKEVEIGEEDANRKAVFRPEIIQTYTRRVDGLVVLTESYLNNFSIRSEITECNHLCGCDENCVNRVVQKGRAIPLEVFQTPKCGFGVRSSKDIVRGQFIEFYLGEIVTQTALQHREEAKAENSSSYTFSLDWWNEGLVEHYHIDGENFGSAMRFINHSCDSNSRSFTVQLEHHGDKRVYYVAFFAIKDIKAGEEITIDYNPQLAKDQDGKLHNIDAELDEGELPDEDDEDTVICQCGAANCRIRLWPKAQTQRKRRRKLRDKVAG